MPSDEKGDKPPPELKPYCYRLTTDRESHSQHSLRNQASFFIFSSSLIKIQYYYYAQLHD